MVSGVQQGRLLHMLVRLSRASRVLEVGCFSGYAALWMGLALPPGGKLLSLERDERAATVARRHLAEAGVGERVEVRLGDAMAALEAMADADEPPFELIFLDADKKRSWEYFELLVSRGMVAPDGLLLVDNVLWKGEVLARLDPDAILATSDAATHLESAARRSMSLRDALHDFSMQLAADERVEQLMLPLRDGLTWVQAARRANPTSAGHDGTGSSEERKLQEAEVALDGAPHTRNGAWDGTEAGRLPAYLRLVGSPEPAALCALRHELSGAATRDLDSVQEVDPRSELDGLLDTGGVQQGRLLHMLVRLSRASRVLEVGCFSGYAALWMGLALPPGGKLLSLERDERAATVARRHLAEAGVGERVEVRLGDAMAALEAMADADEPPFELSLLSAAALQVPSGQLSTEDLILQLLGHMAPQGLLIVRHASLRDARSDAAHSDALSDDLLSRLLALEAVEPQVRVVTVPSPDGDGGVLTLLGRTCE